MCLCIELKRFLSLSRLVSVDVEATGYFSVVFITMVLQGGEKTCLGQSDKATVVQEETAKQ